MAYKKKPKKKLRTYIRRPNAVIAKEKKIRKQRKEEKEKIQSMIEDPENEKVYLDISELKPKYVKIKSDTPHLLMAFVQWYAIPKHLRIIKTQKEWAKKYGLCEDTLSLWKRTEGFFDEVKRYSFQLLRQESANVLYALANKGKTGDARAGEVFLRYVEGEETTLKHQVEGITDERLKQIANATQLWALGRKRLNEKK